MKKNLVIIGASGHGKVIADIAMKMKKWESIFFLDDVKTGSSVLGLSVIGNISSASLYIDDSEFIIAIGNNLTRKLLQMKLESEGAKFAVLIHPAAILGTDVSICSGSVIMAGVVINSSTTVGKGCIINTACSLDHDNVIEDFVHISPGTHLAGTVKVCEETWIGIGSTISNNVTVCGGCIVGAGSVIIRDISEPGTYIGVPARRLY